jgi:hypothetical protein
MKNLALAALLACSLLSGSALAAHPKPLVIDEVVAQQTQIRTDVIAGNGKYRDLPAAKQVELLQRQDSLLALLRGKQHGDLTEVERIEAFNTLEWIEATLNDAGQERTICRRERTVGSNRVTRVCRTEAQIAAERERSREQMMDNQSTMQLRR